MLNYPYFRNMNEVNYVSMVIGVIMTVAYLSWLRIELGYTAPLVVSL